MVLYDKIFLINLASRPDRLKFMHHKLRKIGMENNDYQVVTAINGYSEDMIGLYDRYKGRKYYGTISSPGAIGLIYTWKTLLRDCVEKQYDRILILEDDVYFHKRYHDIIKSNASLFDRYDVVMLGGNQQRWDPKQLAQINIKNYHEYSKNKWCCTYGTYAISLNRKAISVIYDAIKGELQDETPTIDVQINMLIRSNKISGVTMHPPSIIPETRDSDNMATREMIEMGRSRKWKLVDYSCLGMYNKIMKFRHDKINPRQNKKLQISGLPRETMISIFDGKQLPFVFIIPSYRNSKWVERNLKSVFDQNYYNWRAIYIDDASEDDTFEKAQSLVKEARMENRFILTKNAERKYQAYNRYAAYTSCSDEEICIMLDGDDWLAHNDVLTVLNEEYKQHNLLVSYGQFSYFENNRIGFTSGKYEFPKKVVEEKSYRKHQWISQHLRTCRASVIKSIPIEQLQDWEGKWLQSCTDMAEMFYVLENSDGQHKNIGTVLCIYNKDNSLQHQNSYYNENKIKRDKLIKHVRGYPYIHSKKSSPKETATKPEVKMMPKIIPKSTIECKHCYQLEFTPTETFVVPIYGPVERYLFLIMVRLIDNHDYTFQTKRSDINFEVLKYSKVSNDKYAVYVTNKKKISRVGKFIFNLISHCNQCPHATFISQPFKVFSYRNIYTEPVSRINMIDPLIREHEQNVSLVKCGPSWELHRDYALIRVGRIIRNKPKTYHLKLKFNEKTLDIIVNLTNTQASVHKAV